MGEKDVVTWNIMITHLSKQDDDMELARKLFDETPGEKCEVLDCDDSASAGIRHGDIRPENVIHVSSGVRHPYYVLIGWGHAILEERDRPVMNLHFSSTYALEGAAMLRLRDESLVYLLFFTTSGAVQIWIRSRGTLQWREASSRGTPYPMDYEIWLKRMRRRFHEEDHGKEVEVSVRISP
ncbi:hypothetical protein IFM89_010784 [Coptis chinensis]|uniref:Protein kinase domain-containing protein n=1 Tax=Coptis chinensis TaxID=261450 RepID=A0A835M5M7_9MAGN|nr:hypothetical protein IFM89_010784 [Coptis chinensis]